MVRMLLFVTGSTTLLFALDARFGYIALVACPLMAIIILICMRKANPLFNRLQTRIDIINSIMQEDIAGLRTIKAYVHESFEKLRFGKANEELVKTQLSTLIIFAFCPFNLIKGIIVTVLTFLLYKRIERLLKMR